MKKGMKLLIVGAIFGLLGIVVIPSVMVFSFLLNQPEHHQFKVPGETTVKVEEPGRYYLWDDFETIYENQSYVRRPGIADGLIIYFKDEKGRYLDFERDVSMSSESLGEHRKSIGYVHVEEPGEITIQIKGNMEERIFSISRSWFLRFFLTMMLGVTSSVIVGIIGIVMCIVGVVRLATEPQRVKAT